MKYFPTEKDLLYFHFSKMEQFYHYLRFSSWALPTDFRMPSIDGYRPRTSEHYEIGWKHFLEEGRLEASLYYKTRRNVVALRPETFVENGAWQEYIMSGNGDSYGAKFYLYKIGNAGNCSFPMRTLVAGNGLPRLRTGRNCHLCTMFPISWVGHCPIS